MDCRWVSIQAANANLPSEWQAAQWANCQIIVSAWSAQQPGGAAPSAACCTCSYSPYSPEQTGKQQAMPGHPRDALLVIHLMHQKFSASAVAQWRRDPAVGARGSLFFAASALSWRLAWEAVRALQETFGSAAAAARALCTSGRHASA